MQPMNISRQNNNENALYRLVKQTHLPLQYYFQIQLLTQWHIRPAQHVSEVGPECAGACLSTVLGMIVF